MSLQPHVVYLVPEETARVARAAFPRGKNPYMLMRDHLGMIFDDRGTDELPTCSTTSPSSSVQIASASICATTAVRGS